MKALRVKDWDKHYENNRTRELKSMDWVPVPNKMDGFGYAALVTSPQGAAGLGCWLAIVEIASRMKVRGTLARDGSPLTATDLSMISRIPGEVFEAVIPILIHRCNWLEEIEIQGSRQSAVTIPHDDAGCCLRAREERKGREGKGMEEIPPPPSNQKPAEPQRSGSGSQRVTLADLAVDVDRPAARPQRAVPIRTESHDCSEAVTALIDAHPPHRRGKRTLAESQIANITAGVPEAVERLAANHAAWCAYWANQPPQFVPNLVTWLGDGSWRDPPPAEPEDAVTKWARRRM